MVFLTHIEEVCKPTLEFIPGGIAKAAKDREGRVHLARYLFRIRITDRTGQRSDWNFQTPNNPEAAETFVKDMAELGQCEFYPEEE